MYISKMIIASARGSSQLIITEKQALFQLVDTLHQEEKKVLVDISIYMIKFRIFCRN